MKITATYEVRYTFKKIHATSSEVIGEIQDSQFDFTVPIKSFFSGDSNQDSHMLQVTEAATYPSASATGKFKTDHIDAELDFHGIKRNYQLKREDHGRKASFTLDLDAHGIKRPSLLGIKIKNEVLMTFKLGQ